MEYAYFLVWSLKSARSPKRISNQQDRDDPIRELGAIEKFLARTSPGTGKPCTCYGGVFVLDGSTTCDMLHQALTHSIDRHAMLRAFFRKESTSGREHWSISEVPSSELARSILSTMQVPDSEFDAAWLREYECSLNDTAFLHEGPLWKLKVIFSDSMKRMSWNFSVNHGINDQKSTIALVTELLVYINTRTHALNNPALYMLPSMESKEESKEDPDLDDSIEYIIHRQNSTVPAVRDLPISLETALTHDLSSWKIFKWAMQRAFSKPLVEAASVPAKLNRNYREDPVKYAHYGVSEERRSIVVSWTLSKDETDALVRVCHSNNVTVTSALSAANLSVTSLFLQMGNNEELISQNLKAYITVDTRCHGINPYMRVQDPDTVSITSKTIDMNTNIKPLTDWTDGQVACASHCVDFITPVPLSTVTHAKNIFDFESNQDPNKQPVKSENPEFWVLAKQCRAVTKDKVENELDVGILFFEFLIDEIGLLGIIDAPASVNDPLKMGRDSPCGVSNVGVADFKGLDSRSGSGPGSGSGSGIYEDRVSVKEAYFGSGGGRGGSYCFLSCQTVNGCLNNSLHFATPITTMEEAILFKKCFITILKEIITAEIK